MKVEMGCHTRPIVIQVSTILIIDDDRVTARVYQTLLQRAGHKVQIAYDAASGLKEFERLRPDGVLLDLIIPDLSGIEILQHIRASPNGATVPVVVYTNAAVPELVENATKAGATRIFAKADLDGLRLTEAFRTALQDMSNRQVPGTTSST